MKIRVTEWSRRGLGSEGFSANEVVDEARFVELYGEEDLRILKEKRIHSDVIGQGRMYRAEICEEPHGENCSGTPINPGL